MLFSDQTLSVVFNIHRRVLGLQEMSNGDDKMHRNTVLSTTAIGRVRAFDTTPVGMPVLPGAGNVDRNFIQQLVIAGQNAAGQGPTTEHDLMARDEASAYMLPYWDLVDDIVSGFETIQAQGEKYLKKFPLEEKEDYDGRLALAEFTNIYNDIVDTLSGKPFEQEVSLIAEKDKESGDEKPLPDVIEQFTENVDGSGNNLTAFASETFFNGINSAIDWIYVDYPKVDPNTVRTQADEQGAGIRPFWSHVLGRNILEVKSEVIGGAELLTFMRILEPGKPNRVRVFERAINGVVMYALFEEDAKSTTQKRIFNLIEAGPITIGKIPMVPFMTGRRKGRTWKFKPMLRDAADVQIQLYRQESGLNYAKTMTAYPMLAGNGVSPPKKAGPNGGTPERLAVGPARVLYAPVDGNGNVGSWTYVEPSAESLKFLKDDVKETMDQLRELGKQPLTAQSGNLTVITTAVAAGKSRSAVGACALRLKDALENALAMTCLWLNIDKKVFDPQVYVYDEFDDFAEDEPAELTQLRNMRTDRDISRKTYWRELKRRNLLSAEFNAEDEDKALLDETPSDVNPDGTEDLPGASPIGGKPAPKKPTVKPGVTP